MSYARKDKKRARNDRDDFIITLKYMNNAPTLPFDSKLLKIPLDEERFYRYKRTTLEKNFKQVLHHGMDVGMNLDFIDRKRYETPTNSPPLNGADLELMNGVVNRTVKHAPHPALRKQKYLTNDDQHQVIAFTLSKQEEDPEFTSGENYAEWEVTSEMREKLVAEVLQTFRDAEKDPVHPHNKSATVESSVPIFPDDQLFGNPYAEVIFGSIPMPPHDLHENLEDGELDEAHLSLKRKRALLRPLERTSGSPLLGYYIPALKKRKLETSTGKSIHNPQKEMAKEDDAMDIDDLFADDEDAQNSTEPKKDDEDNTKEKQTDTPTQGEKEIENPPLQKNDREENETNEIGIGADKDGAIAKEGEEEMKGVAMDVDDEDQKEEKKELDIPDDASPFDFLREYSFAPDKYSHHDAKLPIILSIDPDSSHVSYVELDQKITLKPETERKPLKSAKVHLVKHDNIENFPEEQRQERLGRLEAI